MGIGTSIFLIAVGAILKYAVTGHISGIEIDTVGLILMIVGILGLVISLLYLAMWSDRTRRQGYPDEAPPPPRNPTRY
jgi:Domain of unknown function (DUF6458)